MASFFTSLFQWFSGQVPRPHLVSVVPYYPRLTLRLSLLRLFFSKQAEISVVGLQV